MMSSWNDIINAVEFMIKRAFGGMGKNAELCIKNRTT